MNFYQTTIKTLKNKNLLALSITCFFWSVSSLMVFSILPCFMTEELKISKLKLGWIEGIAITLAFVSKIISGIISDYIKKRRPLLIIGTLLSLIFKSFFALATGGWWIFFARAMDRIAKGVRSSPADALIADISKKDEQGMNYGVRQFFYIMGSVVGSIIASALLYTYNYRTVFWCALIPVATALFIIIKYVDDPLQQAASKKFDWHWRDLKHLPTPFWQLIIVSFVLMLSRFSESFLTLRGREIGLSVAMLPLLMVGYELMHALLALPTGWFADRVHRKKLLLLGIFILMLTNGVMIQATSPAWIVAGYLLAGSHMGMTQSLISTLIAENTMPNLRGSAFSIYYFSTGLAVLIANPLAGHLSEYYHTSAGPFYGGAIFSTLSCVLLAFFLKKRS